MSILHGIEDYINTFNSDNDIDFATDTIRIEFKKRYKLESLKNLGVWKKINKNDKSIMAKLKKRLTPKQITSAYKMQGENIYYFNSSTPPKYDDATLVIYGLKQYHKPPPPKELVTKIIFILKNVSSLDICLDVDYVPNFDLIAQCYNLDRCSLNGGIVTDTRYSNKPDITMIDKITIYDKANKNGLEGILWRIEATITVPNIKMLVLPLDDLKEFTDTTKGILCKMYIKAIEQKKMQSKKLEKFSQKIEDLTVRKLKSYSSIQISKMI
jgi:hypothetical protein